MANFSATTKIGLFHQPVNQICDSLRLSQPLEKKLALAKSALEKLELAGTILPSIQWFIYGCVRKEAIISSQIEGTQATFTDLLTVELGESSVKPSSDVDEICNYLAAFKYASQQLSSPKGLPLSIRLLNETHKKLLKGVRGKEKCPGEVRKTQNWIGGTRPGNAMYVPPPPEEVSSLLSDLEKFIHETNSLDPLIRIGLLHAHFETIHPYLDGNGRIGRLLISLLLKEWKLLNYPLLYISLFFKRNQKEYYRQLTLTRTDGAYESWLDFFLEGMTSIAEESVKNTRDIFKLITADRNIVMRASTSTLITLRLFELLPENPMISPKKAIGLLKSSKPTVNKAFETLERLNILKESSGKKRDRHFVYVKYLHLLQEDFV